MGDAVKTGNGNEAPPALPEDALLEELRGLLLVAPKKEVVQIQERLDDPGPAPRTSAACFPRRSRCGRAATAA